ncbi:hypothetical protein HK407_09g14770 [Ordospora pajunii]|uniref:uncharacterized protein n=1 Tax=Ordospora pajunii TaxID=3039483 RepID=UPI00295284B2|nr:uncharacterized protein HK407_09g14770 [Ordospora pajunii]KAH9410882.1 hypothetical protein HK407_09g14770 [Ordospora pajunii]
MRPVFLHAIISIGIVVADSAIFKIASKLEPTKFFTGEYNMIMSSTEPALEFVKWNTSIGGQYMIQGVDSKKYLDIENNVRDLVIWPTSVPANQRQFMFLRTDPVEPGFQIITFKSSSLNDLMCLQYDQTTGKITRETCSPDNPQQIFIFDHDIVSNIETEERMALERQRHCPGGDYSKCGKPNIVIINKTSDDITHPHSHASRLSHSHGHLNNHSHGHNYFSHLNLLDNNY